MTTPTFPVHVDAHLDPQLSRWLWLVKWLLAIPHYIVLAFLWLAFAVVSVFAFFAILFTGRYPRSLFDFNVGVMRWSWRVTYYAYGALGTDRYPPFSLQERPDYPAHLEVDYPEHLSRGLVLVKWWLLAIPHYLVIGFFLGGAGFALTADDRAADNPQLWSTGLIGLLVFFAGIALLFTGRYPQPVFDFVLGLNRWVLRVAGYAGLMTDQYPPFRLDQGGDDPGTLRPAPTTATAPAPAYAAPAAPSAPQPWTAGRIVSMVIGSLLLVGSLGLGLAGGSLAFADQVLRDDDGFLMSGEQTLTTDTYALTSTSLEVHADGAAAFMPNRLIGDARLTATGNSDTPVFVGVATTSDVDAFLGDTRHATVTDLSNQPAYDTSGSTAPSSLPGDSDIWVAQSSGTGTQQVTWPVEKGDWTILVMNADGSRGVTADLTAGATVPALDWVVPTLLISAGLGLVAAIALMAFALHTRRPPSGARSGDLR